MTWFSSRLLAALLVLAPGMSGVAVSGQQNPAPAPATASRDTPQSTSSKAAKQTQTRAQLRAQRRARRLASQQQSAAPIQMPPVSTTAAQRAIDQKLLDQQKAQSAETAHENDAVTTKVIQDQQRVQAEPRIQDAPGPGSQPLPGDAAVQPTQPADPPRIQDAPGPAQTLPKPPPAAPAPSPQS